MTSRGLFRTFFNWGGKIAHLYTKRVLTAQKECVLSASVCTFCNPITLFIDAAGRSRCHSPLMKLPE